MKIHQTVKSLTIQENLFPRWGRAERVSEKIGRISSWKLCTPTPKINLFIFISKVLRWRKKRRANMPGQKLRLHFRPGVLVWCFLCHFENFHRKNWFTEFRRIGVRAIGKLHLRIRGRVLFNNDHLRRWLVHRGTREIAIYATVVHNQHGLLMSSLE